MRGVEVALVARALHLSALGLVVDDAAEVRALLAERPQLAAEVQEDGRVVAGRVAEQVRLADGDLVERDDRAGLAGVDERSWDQAARPTLPAANPPEASTR